MCVDMALQVTVRVVGTLFQVMANSLTSGLGIAANWP